MAEERKHTNTYSAADIEKYWTGKLTPAEMHAMEKAALDDPFLADAMEGYSRFANGSENIQNDLAALRADLKTRTKPGRNVIMMNWWKLAGAAVIVVSLGAFAYLLLNRQGESRLAMEQVNRQNEKSVPATNDSVQASVHDSLQQLLPYTPESTHQTAAPQEVSKAKAPAKIQSKIIHGVVRDEENRPVPGASVELQGRIPGIAITDSAGRFRLPAGDSAVKLNVASEGYATASRKIEQSEASKEIQIAISGKAAGIQIDNGTKRSKKASAVTAKADDPKAATGTESASGAEPVDGWDAFRLYLDSDKKVPYSLRDVHGIVELEFNLTRSRKVSDIKITRSLHPVLDSEAIRLIENGPRWKPLNGKRTGITVRIGF